ncbi:hypothetical protein A2U01_0103827 [Trifolium medium]|uniref:Uncharacterized protein n=1 Tax=Trifolium medium TaxID=97028 RepID=A0A392V563_9FABA|nr:hypothetical protein [Trifolium medium]
MLTAAQRAGMPAQRVKGRSKAAQRANQLRNAPGSTGLCRKRDF